MIGLILLSVVLIVIGFYLLNKNGENGLEPRKIPQNNNEIVWENFENRKFDIQLQYPEHFKTFEFKGDDTMGPIINFYFDNEGEGLPIDFDDSLSGDAPNNISIFPEGVLGRGISVYHERVEYTNENGVEFELYEFKTPSDETWSIMAIPKTEVDSWTNYGFIIVSSKVKNKANKCLSGGVEKAIESCDPYSGDIWYLDGDVDSEFVEVGREFLNRFNFK